MMSWQAANRIANIAAAQAHHALGVDPVRYPVQVAPAIYRAGLAQAWRPLSTLFGAYLTYPGGVAGVLVNANMTRAVRRHTAAHELGHHRLGHRSGVENGWMIGQNGGSIRGRASWSPEEKAAEAFATWFLMPRQAVLAALSNLGVDRPVDAAQVYQLSLLLGTGFASTTRHLVSLRLASVADARAWAKVPPSTIKRGLLATILPSTSDMDVWDICRVRDEAVYVSPGDLIVLRPPARLVGVVGPMVESGRPADGVGTVLACTAEDTATDTRSGNRATLTLVSNRGGSRGRITVVVQPRPMGVYRCPNGHTNVKETAPDDH